MATQMVCSCKTPMIELSGKLKNGKLDEGRAFACPKCDVPEGAETKTIIQLSEEKGK